MKSAYSPSFHGGKLVFRRELCVNCQKETIFRGWECQTCKVMQRRDKNGGIPKDHTHKSFTELFAESRKKARRFSTIRNDKREAARLQAAASRAKFEGSK